MPRSADTGVETMGTSSRRICFASAGRTTSECLLMTSIAHARRGLANLLSAGFSERILMPSSTRPLFVSLFFSPSVYLRPTSGIRIEATAATTPVMMFLKVSDRGVCFTAGSLSRQLTVATLLRMVSPPHAWSASGAACVGAHYEEAQRGRQAAVSVCAPTSRELGTSADPHAGR